MKNNFYLTLAFLAVFYSCKKENETAEARTPEKFPIEDFYNTTDLYSSGFNADETKVLISSNKTGIYNAYELTIDDTTSVQLTKSDKQSIYINTYLPGSSKFIYSADNGGDENSHLYLFDRKTDSAKDLTPWAKSTNSLFAWSRDKKNLYVSSNKRDPRFFDIHKLDTVNWKSEVIFTNNDAFTPSAMSQDERYFALTKSLTTDSSELYLFDNKTKTSKKITSAEGHWDSMAFEKDNSALYYITNFDSEFNYLVRYDIASGKSEKYFEDKWDVIDMTISENSKYHSITINEDGKNKILLFEHASKKPVELPDFDDGDVQSVTFAKSETKLLLRVGSSTSPADIFLYDIPTKKLKQLTSVLNKKINRADLVKAEVIRFKSFDGKEIPAIYYKPLQASKDNKVPAILWIHGGPGGQTRTGYSNSIQYLVNNGYAVLAVNNRGSSGYGKTFYKLDNKDHSNGDLKDCIWGKKWLQEQDYIDKDAIGILGGSYGGCMVLGALAFHPDEFKVGVNLFGVANWPRTLKSIPPYWESFRKALYEEMGDPFTADSVRLKKISPLFNYEKITKPLLVFQGANDVRVLPIESDEIVAGVKKNGVPVEYVVYSDEGHGFVKKENQITTDKKTLGFLDNYLRTNKK